MINVIIVEDNKSAAESLIENLKRYETENGVTFMIEVEYNVINFLTNYKPKYDCVFMDIQMPLMNGMEASKKLREADSDVPLVFVTNMSNFAVKGYSVGALDFIVKPITYSGFAATIDKLVRFIDDKSDRLVLKVAGGFRKVLVNTITYIEVLDHKVFYHLDNNESVAVWGSLKENVKNLPAGKFSQCNDCYVVNLKYVTRIDKNTVTLNAMCGMSDYKTEIPISRSRKKEFNRQFLEFCGKNS